MNYCDINKPNTQWQQQAIIETTRYITSLRVQTEKEIIAQIANTICAYRIRVTILLCPFGSVSAFSQMKGTELDNVEAIQYVKYAPQNPKETDQIH